MYINIFAGNISRADSIDKNEYKSWYMKYFLRYKQFLFALNETRRKQNTIMI